MAKNTHHDDFSEDAFFIAVVTSEMLKSFPEQQQQEVKWFLFNSSEETQRSFYKIFAKEQKALAKIQKEESKLAAEFLQEWKAANSEIQNTMKKGMRKINEDFARGKDHAAEKALLKKL